MGLSHLTARALKEKLERGEAPLLIDVREPWEHGLAQLEGARLIPLGTLEAHWIELPRDRPLVFLCHHGLRSLHACRLALAHGFDDVSNLEGGIDAWSFEVDPDVPRY